MRRAATLCLVCASQGQEGQDSDQRENGHTQGTDTRLADTDTIESLSPGILGVWTATTAARWAGTCIAYKMHSHLHLPSPIELYLPRPPLCGASQMRQRYGFSSWQTVSTQPVSYHTRFFG